MLDTLATRCPWCGERFDIVVDRSAGSTQYVEDCPVCCRPITCSLELDDGGQIADFSAEREG
jgi:hypothetical protein